MEFPDSYFEDETRCGFYVPSQMKRCWASAIEVLDDIAHVCEKYHLEWFAAWGTLLGTVRHAGFVPWDDDLDIYMKRRDYEKFLSVASRELPDNYSLVNFHNDPEYDQFLTRVVSGRSIDLNHNTLEKYHGFPYIAGVDIFPLDYMSRNTEQDNIQQILIQAALGARDTVMDANSTPEEKEEYIALFEELSGAQIDRNGNIPYQLFMYADKLMQLYDENDADYITLMALWTTHGSLRFTKESFAKSVWMPFESVAIKVPIGYREVLSKLYGRYWEYVRTWAAHNYPYYKGMAAQVKQVFGYGPTVFPFDKNMWDSYLQERRLKREKWIPGTAKTVLLLPWKNYMWESMSGIYRAAVSSGCKVIVSPIIYANKDMDRRPDEYNTDYELFPGNVELTDPETLDIEALHPDVIFFQCPYDEYNDSVIADERFFAANLNKHTPNLVYIPPFDMDDIYSDDERGKEFFDEFGKVAGIFYADRVYVQSEIMRDLYIKQWTSIAGEDTESIWRDRIRSLGNIRDDELLDDPYEMFDIPEEWLDLIVRPDGSRRDLIMYNPLAGLSASHASDMLNKIKDDMELFKRNGEDTVMLWRPDQGLTEYITGMNPKLRWSYEEIIRKFRDEKIGILDESDDLLRAIMLTSAYIGDPGSLVPVYRRAKRPVLIRNKDMLYSEVPDMADGHIYPGRGTVFGDRFYFLSGIYPGLYSVGLSGGDVVRECDLPETNKNGRQTYGNICEYKGKLYILPWCAKDLAVFDPVLKSIETISFWNDNERRENYIISCGIVVKGFVFLFRYYSDTVFRIKISTKKVERLEGWGMNLNYPYAPNDCTTDGRYVYAGDIMEDCYTRMDIQNFTIEVNHLPNADTRYYGMCVYGDNLWMAPYEHGSLVKVGVADTRLKETFDLKEVSPRNGLVYFRDIVGIGDELLLFPMSEPCFYAFNLVHNTFRKEYLGLDRKYLMTADPGLDGFFESHASVSNNSIFVLLYQRSELLVYDRESGRSKVISLTLPETLKEKAREWMLDYMTADTVNRPAYVEQRYFGIPEFTDNLHSISEEIRARSEDHHVGRDILVDIWRN